MRVILDATEIYVQKPHLPELQQMTFSNYKNCNTYKGLVGISPEGVITFVSSLFPGCISDKELTRRSGLLDLLEPGDSVMADRGFDIEDLLLRGVQLNIPPFFTWESSTFYTWTYYNSANCFSQDPCGTGHGENKKLPYF